VKCGTNNPRYLLSSETSGAGLAPVQACTRAAEGNTERTAGTDIKNDEKLRMMGCTDRWLQLPEIAKLFGLSEDSIRRLAKTHRLPLRRVTPLATPGALETELIEWIKNQPLTGPPVRHKRQLARTAPSVSR